MPLKDKIEYELVVIENFAEYVKGQVITDAKKIAELIESEWQSHVVKKAADTPKETPPAA